MRYREEVLDELYPRLDLSEYYVLWVDLDILFPYAFNDAQMTLRLNGPNIVHQDMHRKDLFLLRDFINSYFIKSGDWYSISKSGKYKGIPYFFKTYEQLSQVRQIVGFVEFNYLNMNMDQSKCVVCVTQNVDFQQEQNRKDYCVTLQGTIIPTLLEKVYDNERKEIITRFENVIQANQYKNDATIQSNSIKITSEDIEYNREAIISAMYAWINNSSQMKRNTFLHMFVNENIFIEKPVPVNVCKDLSALI